jgi:DNA repair protein RecN (Recombination protein N)
MAPLRLMLTHLDLKDLVIVDRAELELQAGMTALTGETGAGKSIIVDALLLVAGGRAAGDIVRQGAERAEVTASFAQLPPAALHWLEAQCIEFDGDLVLRRVINSDGRTRAYVNGQVVPLQSLRELAAALIEIHGQQEFQRLVNRAAQRELLDERLPDAAPRLQVAQTFERLKSCRREFEALQAAAQNRDARLDLLRFQVQELKADVTTVENIEALFADQKRIAGKGRLGSATRLALTAAYEAEGDSAHDLLGRAQTALRAVADGEAKLAAATKLLGEAAILTQEAARELQNFLEALDIDPARQDEIERRAAALEALARKHRVPVWELPDHLERLEAELDVLERATSSLTALRGQLEALTNDYNIAAVKLHRARTAAAAKLGIEVTQLMQSLGMGGGKFSIAVDPSGAEPSASGSDDIEFLVSANPGQPLKGLAKVASGGELSRISLAIQVAGAAPAAAGSEAGSAPASLCMVFDEVDAGIGGAVAEIVGRQLRALGEHAQVLCVTHLAQVASQAHRQFRVTKLTDGKITRTALKRLAESDRVDEIARMLGGVDITEQARAHARDMLARGATAESGKKRRSRAQT